MTEAQVKLAKRAVACKGWRWMPGMLAALDRIGGDYRARVCRVEGDKFWSDATSLPYDLVSYVPDLTDAATLGCLLALVREAWESYGTFVSTHRYDGGEWSIRTLPLPMFSTEAEALVAALEAAP